MNDTLNNSETPLCFIHGVSDSALYLGDCLNIMDNIEQSSIDTIIADIPYFYLYGHSWDKQWKDISEYSMWVEKCLIQCKKILKSNGNIVIFTSQELNDVVCSLIRKHFFLLSNMIWDKTHAGGAEKGKKTINKPLSRTERFILATRTENPFGDRIRYLLSYKSKKQIDLVKYCTGKKTGLVGLWLSDRNKHGACEPTEAMWVKVCEFFGVEFDYDKYKRTFYSEHLPYDIVCMKPVSGLHPCEKPIELMKMIINSISNDGDLVLDFTMGSGTTCLAAKELNRRFIGIEKEPKYYEIACQRIGV